MRGLVKVGNQVPVSTNTENEGIQVNVVGVLGDSYLHLIAALEADSSCCVGARSMSQPAL